MFSIIIPVHNAEKTLKKCLDSLISQTYENYEVILIENGSTDKSFSICLEYAKKDKRFKVLDIGECKGPSKPRNVGIDKAEGDYIAFLDADDWFGEKVLEMLNNCFSQPEIDVVFFGICMKGDSLDNDNIFFPQVKATDNAGKSIELHQQGCFGYTCCKAFRRMILRGIRFDENITLFEDELFCLNAVEYARTIISVPKQYDHHMYFYFHFNDSENSLMSFVYSDMIELKDKEYIAWKDYLADSYQNALDEFANKSVAFCRHYIFEHHFRLRESYQKLLSSTFYQDAVKNPKIITRIISKGYLRFRLDWILWKIKTTLR